MKRLAALALLAAVPAAATPARVASLNLCTDEYLLLLARPQQVASISRLGADPQETPLAARARTPAGQVPTNSGRLADVVAARPDLVLTMGHDPQAAALALRLGIPLVALPYPQSPAEVVGQVRRVAGLLGNPAAGEAFARDVAALAASAPARPKPGLMIGGSGLAPSATGLVVGWLRLAGVTQRQSGAVALEQLLADPPPLLIINRYRSGQRSQPQAWSSHPALARLPAAVRTVAADGRAFLCGGAAMPAEIARLKRAIAA